MTAQKKDRCPHATRAFNEQGEVVSLACDRWDCLHCRGVLAFRWAQRVSYGIALRPLAEPWFWTLTLPSWVQDSRTGYKILPGRWDRLRRIVQREAHAFSYCAFIEAHPHRRLIPHVHIITFAHLRGRLKDLAVHAGFGYQAKAVEINGRIAVSYVAKYASKQGAGMPRNFRRVRVSRDWPELPSPVYQLAVYPLRRGEPLSAYLRRVSRLTARPYMDVRDRWLDHSRDLA